MYKRQLYAESLSRYGLKLRPEVKFEELGWAFNALQTRETWERLGGSVVEPRVAFDGGRWSVTALTSLMVLSGSVLDVDAVSYTHLTDIETAKARPIHSGAVRR